MHTDAYMCTHINIYTYVYIQKQISKGHFKKDYFTMAKFLDDCIFFNILPLILYIFFCNCLYLPLGRKTYLKTVKILCLKC